MTENLGDSIMKTVPLRGDHVEIHEMFLDPTVNGENKNFSEDKAVLRPKIFTLF